MGETKQNKSFELTENKKNKAKQNIATTSDKASKW